MEIMLNDLLRNVEFLDIDENAKIDSEKNFIIFGSNGLGKTTIYKNLKNKYPDFDYLDYEESKDLFKKNKSKIEISLGINKLEDLLAQKLDNRNQVKIKKISMIFHGFYCTLKIPEEKALFFRVV